MLSDLERDRLETRETDTPKTRAMNDMRAKKKFVSWLEDSSDALLILRKIPFESFKNGLSDIDVYRLLIIAESIMTIRQFAPVAGKSLEPGEWIAEGHNTTRPATSIDIARSSLIDEHISILNGFLGGENPVANAIAYATVAENPMFKDRFSESERAIAKANGERVLSSIDEYTRMFVNKREEPPK